ncbi:hypothetical protein EON64_10075 [archaeon]|nr:MAG: hypothetical protein EON64_10075 [archaeon]
MQMPKGFGLHCWMDYVTSAGRLAPRDQERNRVSPRGVLQLGGTVALDDGDVGFAYADGVPDDYLERFC